MSLLRDYDRKSAEFTRDKGQQVVTGCRSRTEFSSLKAEVDALDASVTALKAVIVARNLRNNTVNAEIKVAKIDVVQKMDAVLKKAREVCNGDESLEVSTGFTLGKPTRTTRTEIASAVLVSASATGSPGYLLLKIMETIPGNLGYEVHYIFEGKDYIACVARVDGRTKTMLASNFPCGVKVELYMITLATNKVRSIPSNRVPGQAI